MNVVISTFRVVDSSAVYTTTRTSVSSVSNVDGNQRNMNSVLSVSNVDENRRNMNIEKKTFTLIKQGSEAKIYSGTFHGKPCILKERFPKKYRHPDLDREITTSRLKQEVRSLMRCRLTGN